MADGVCQAGGASNVSLLSRQPVARLQLSDQDKVSLARRAERDGRVEDAERLYREAIEERRLVWLQQPCVLTSLLSVRISSPVESCLPMRPKPQRCCSQAS